MYVAKEKYIHRPPLETCVYALMFTSVTEKVKEIQGKMLCRGHFLIQQNPPEHAQDWLEITLLWLFFIC